MRSTLFIFLLIIPLFASGQFGYSVDLLFSPEQSFRTLAPEEIITVRVRNEEEEKKFGYRYGLNLSFYFGETIAIKTGVRYVDSGYNSKLDGIFYDYKYIEIPFAVRYYFSDGRFRLFTEIGVGVNFHMEGEFSPLIEQRWVNHAALVSVGLDFDYSPDLSIFLQPIFRYHMSETFYYYSIEEHLYSLGVEAGFRIQLY